MAQNVLVDAQFSLSTVLKPYKNFEGVYQGKTALAPMPFFGPDKNGDRPPLDPDAGRAGFAPNLLRYVDVPFGARVVLWIPQVVFVPGPPTPVQLGVYSYGIQWRMRNVTDFRNRRTPYHLPNQFPGQPDTSVAPPEPRFVIPGATRSVVYMQPEASVLWPLGAATQHLRRELIEVDGGGVGLNSTSIELPFLPGGTRGAYQQGVLDPAVVADVASQSLFVVLWFDAEGDQMMVTAQRNSTLGANWDFATVDRPFSNIYGTDSGAHAEFPDIGIYMFVGSNP